MVLSLVSLVLALIPLVLAGADDLGNGYEVCQIIGDHHRRGRTVALSAGAGPVRGRGGAEPSRAEANPQ